jgi:hypothetical protein
VQTPDFVFTTIELLEKRNHEHILDLKCQGQCRELLAEARKALAETDDLLIYHPTLECHVPERADRTMALSFCPVTIFPAPLLRGSRLGDCRSSVARSGDCSFETFRHLLG